MSVPTFAMMIPIVMVGVVMPLPLPIIAAMPVVSSPITMSVVDHGRRSVVARRLVNDRRRRWTPAERIEIEVDLYASVGRETRQQRECRKFKSSDAMDCHASVLRDVSCPMAMTEYLVGGLFLAG